MWRGWGDGAKKPELTYMGIWSAGIRLPAWVALNNNKMLVFVLIDWLLRWI